MKRYFADANDFGREKSIDIPHPLLFEEAGGRVTNSLLGMTGLCRS